jgi:hypothetical protein
MCEQSRCLQCRKNSDCPTATPTCNPLTGLCH